MPKLAVATESTKSDHQSMFRATHFEYELPFLRDERVPFNIISIEGDYVRIEVDAYYLTAYGSAMKKCGYRMACNNHEKNIPKSIKSVA